MKKDLIRIAPSMETPQFNKRTKHNPSHSTFSIFSPLSSSPFGSTAKIMESIVHSPLQIHTKEHRRIIASVPKGTISSPSDDYLNEVIHDSNGNNCDHTNEIDECVLQLKEDMTKQDELNQQNWESMKYVHASKQEQLGIMTSAERKNDQYIEEIQK